jgi:hypothetical protein
MEQNITKYKPGQELTYKPGKQTVKVVHNTLQPGGVNAQEAVVWIETKQGTPIAIPVLEQDRYLTTEPPKKAFKLWPLGRQAL